MTVIKSMPDTQKPCLLPRLRIMVGKEIALGPGKVDLLEAIERTGSISSAARELGLSYRRAWVLVDTMNRCFQSPLVTRATGGKGGGGAGLSDLGKHIAHLYRQMETKTHDVVREEWDDIRKSIKPTGKPSKQRSRK